MEAREPTFDETDWPQRRIRARTVARGRFCIESRVYVRYADRGYRRSKGDRHLGYSSEGLRIFSAYISVRGTDRFPDQVRTLAETQDKI